MRNQLVLAVVLALIVAAVLVALHVGPLWAAIAAIIVILIGAGVA